MGCIGSVLGLHVVYRIFRLAPGMIPKLLESWAPILKLVYNGVIVDLQGFRLTRPIVGDNSIFFGFLNVIGSRCGPLVWAATCFFPAWVGGEVPALILRWYI